MKNLLIFFKKKIYEKKLLYIVCILLFIILIIKSLFNYIETKTISYLKSKDFEYYIFTTINNKLESFADRKLTEKDKIFYKENFKKIYLQYKPIFNEIIKEVE
jgi:hypothetical protein